MGVAQNLLLEIYELWIKNSPTSLDFLTKRSHLIAKHGDILKGLNDPTKSSILQVAVKLDPVHSDGKSLKLG